MLLLTPAWCAAAAGTALAVWSINDESIAQMRTRHPLVSAEVDDPVYKRKQRYEGFWLRDVLAEMKYAGHAEADIYVRFRCKDGYLPIMPLSRALRGDGLVAIRDLHAAPGKDWAPSTASREPSTPSPSYLVWASSKGDTDEYPWPYQMISIELVSAADALGELAPEGSKKSGYDLFVTHCLKCHGINGVGGTFGPELNTPCNVTEYWNPGFLSKFIAQASSVRAGTKMPDFHSMPRSDIQAIVDYLQYMSGHKKAGAVCQAGR
jgi:mono/diheme cytochrome c family protein